MSKLAKAIKETRNFMKTGLEVGRSDLTIARMVSTALGLLISIAEHLLSKDDDVCGEVYKVGSTPRWGVSDHLNGWTITTKGIPEGTQIIVRKPNTASAVRTENDTATAVKPCPFDERAAKGDG